MEFLQQTIKLLSEPPGSVIYHLVTLFALQIVFAISYSRWQRSPDDSQAQRLTWASAAIFLGRLILLFVSLININEPQELAGILPPLVQAINTVTITLLVWSLVPQTSNSTRVPDIALVVVIVFSVAIYLFFAQGWQNQIKSGITNYNITLQAAVWSIIQIITLTTGLVYYLLKTSLKESIPIITIVVLLLAAVTQLFSRNEIITTDTNIPYMIRFGYLIAFPLWAVYAYQLTLTPLLATESTHQSSMSRFGTSLESAAQVIATKQPQRRIALSIDMATNLIEAEFAAIGLIDSQNPLQMHFTSNLPEGNSSEFKSWTINLSQQTAINLAFKQDSVVELMAEGLGARQLHDFYKAISITPQGPLLIHPLTANRTNIGLLIVAAQAEQKSWPPEKKELMMGLAKYQAQAILNSQIPSEPAKASPPQPGPRVSTSAVPSAILLDQVQLHGLRAENDELQRKLDKAKLETKQAEAKALAAQKQARYLATVLRTAQQSDSSIEESNLNTKITTANQRSSNSTEGKDS